MAPAIRHHALFQSTPSVWRETTNGSEMTVLPDDFNPLPPCGGRRPVFDCFTVVTRISIHSLRVEGDAEQKAKASTQMNFNPLPPCGGRPPDCGGCQTAAYFNPLPPCGGRREPLFIRLGYITSFQSTPSVWRETVNSISPINSCHISIHSLRVEGDLNASHLL